MGIISDDLRRPNSTTSVLIKFSFLSYPEIIDDQIIVVISLRIVKCIGAKSVHIINQCYNQYIKGDGNTSQ